MVTATIQRYTTVDDGYGGEKQEWQDYLEVDGFLDQLNADEVLASEKVQAISTHVFITFEIEDITPSDRAIIDGWMYNIQNVDNPMQMDRQLEIQMEFTGDKHG